MGGEGREGSGPKYFGLEPPLILNILITHAALTAGGSRCSLAGGRSTH